MLFARGNWSIFGVRKESQAAFEAAIDSGKLAEVSQGKALAASKADGVPTYGINPYEFPRLDEEGRDFTPDLMDLGDGAYGFWMVFNEHEDVTDPKSKQEGLAYAEAGKPFKFLSRDEKKVIEASVVASAVLAREQFPVIIDFNSEAVYVASSNAEQVGIVRGLVADLGGEDFDLGWQFESPDWTRKFLNAVVEKNKFEGEMNARAEELMRFSPDEIEKLDDRMMESIVSGYFAMAELETGQWAGLSNPARISINSSYDPVAVSAPSTAFSVIHEFKKSEVVAAAVVFQSLDSKFNKKGEEKQFRMDLLTIDVNDNINLTDAGAAMLRGFDLPAFKRDMKKAAKARETPIAIGDYWREWLSGMKTAVNIFVDNVTETLKIDKKRWGLKPYSNGAAAAQ